MLVSVTWTWLLTGSTGRKQTAHYSVDLHPLELCPCSVNWEVLVVLYHCSDYKLSTWDCVKLFLVGGKFILGFRVEGQSKWGPRRYNWQKTWNKPVIWWLTLHGFDLWTGLLKDYVLIPCFWQLGLKALITLTLILSSKQGLIYTIDIIHKTQFSAPPLLPPHTCMYTPANCNEWRLAHIANPLCMCICVHLSVGWFLKWLHLYGI